jgi:hypothetical protein
LPLRNPRPASRVFFFGAVNTEKALKERDKQGIKKRLFSKAFIKKISEGGAGF